MTLVEKRAYSLSGTEDLDLTVQSVTATIVDQNLIDSCNQDACYGFSNWTLNIAQNVSGKTYDMTNPDSASTEVGGKIYQIYQISGNTLLLGNVSGTDNGKSEPTRPIAIDSTTSMVKQ